MQTVSPNQKPISKNRLFGYFKGTMDSDRNLLFGVLAVQEQFLGRGQWSRAYRAWVEHQDESLAEFLVKRGLLCQEQRARLEEMVRTELDRHGGDVRTTLLDL